MPILHLGVIDIPYVDATGKKSATVTTGQVAGWLEDKYHPMEIFITLHGQDVILPALESAVEGTMETMMMRGSPVSKINLALWGMIIVLALKFWLA